MVVGGRYERREVGCMAIGCDGGERRGVVKRFS